MKRVLAIILSVLMVFLAVPAETYAAEGDVLLTVTADKSTVGPGETIRFTVSMGAAADLGALQFNLVIPEGLSFVEDSVILPEGIEATLNSDGAIAKPAEKNNYVWAYSAQTPGYTGSETLTILEFSCTVDGDAAQEAKSLSLSIDGCYDFTNIAYMGVSVTPVNFAIGDAPAHVHTDIQHHDAAAATCVAAGNVEYWTCSGVECAGKYYGDATCENVLSEIVVQVNPSNHVGGTWSAEGDRHVLLCACGAALEEGAHVYDNDGDASCNICDYQRTLPGNGGTSSPDQNQSTTDQPEETPKEPDTTAQPEETPKEPDTSAQPEETAKEPKTADSLFSVATLAMVGGMGYLADMFVNKRNRLGMSESQKNMLIQRIIEKTRKRNKLVRWFAIALIAVILAFYYSIGKKNEESLRELAQLA